MKLASTKYILLALVASTLTLNALGQTTSLVSIDGNAHLTYTPDANGNIIPDFSYVGYHHGEKPIPYVEVAKTISPVEGDNRSNIQSTIDYVAGLPADANGHRGAVLLNAGLYEVDGTIFMKGGVVLRGEGNATIIRAVFTTQDPLISVNSGSSPSHDIWESTQKKITDSYLPFGAKSFTIEPDHSFSVGDRVVLQRVPTQTWVNLIGTDNVAPESPWSTGSFTIDFFRVIEAIDGNLITIDAPVVDHIYTGIANGYLYKYLNSQDYKTEIGIEDMRLESAYINEQTLDHSHTAIEVYAAENGWVRNVDTYHFTYSTVAFNNGSYKWTVDNCRYFRPVGVLNSGTRYAFNINGGAHQILIQNCFSDFGRHDFATGSRVPGPSVFSNCKAMNCWNVTGPHHRWATGILYDRVDTDLDLNVENRTNSGSGHGYAGANHVLWNCSTYSRMVVHDPPTDANNWAIGCIAGEGVTGIGRLSTEAMGIVESEGAYIEDIPSLYRAQLDDRLGAGTASTDNPFPGFTGDQTIYPDELTIASAVAGNEAEHHGITRLAKDSYDNDVQTRWASDRELPNVSGAWIEYSFDKTYEIYKIRFQLFNSWIRTYSLRIEIDGTAIFAGTSQLTEEMGWNEFSFSPVSGSKVKISMTKKNSYDYTELAIHEAKIYGATSVTTHNLTVNSGSGDGSYVASSNINITAETKLGKVFNQWTGDTSAVKDIYAASTMLTMPDSDVQVTATYQITSNLTVNSGYGGGNYIEGTSVAISADVLSNGKIFDQWTGNVEAVADIYSASTTLTMPAADIQVNAIYQSPLTLTPSADAYVRGGTYGDINYGSEQKMEIKRPLILSFHREGFIKFDLSSIPKAVNAATLRMYVNLNQGGAKHSCSMVDDDSWTEAGITYNNKPGAADKIASKEVPAAGKWIEFDVTDQVNTEILGDNVISFQIADEADNIQVEYATKEGANPPELSYGFSGVSNIFTITASAGPNGSMIPDGNYTVTEGSDHLFLFWGDSGYTLENVMVDGVSMGAVEMYLLNDVASDHTISASFVQSAFSIVASAGSNGSITPNGSLTVDRGADQEFTITAESGYFVEDVLVDGESQGAISSYTFSNVEEDHTISASFAVDLTYGSEYISESNSSIKIFPNPSNGHININGISGEANVRIFDLLGKELMSIQCTGNQVMDLSNIEAGIYLIEVRYNNKLFIERMIKK